MIIPAILPRSQRELDEKVEQLGEAGFSGLVQVDVCDGVFVPSSTDFNTLPEISGITYQLDLMVALQSPGDVQKYLDLHPVQIVLHLESLENPGQIITSVRNAGIGVGLSILNDTPITSLDPYMTEIDFVQLMGISEIGFQGQPFDERVFDKIDFLRQNYSNMTICVDGGVSIATINRLFVRGVTQFVSGGAVFSGDIAENITNLRNMIH